MIAADEDPFGTALLAPAPKASKRAPKPKPEHDTAAPYVGAISFTIHGQPASKANSRQIVVIAGRAQVIKSKAALAYEENALKQIPPKARVRIEGPVRVTLRIFYESERPDLDESVVLDVLQDRFKKVKETGDRVLIQAGVYRNDRQVREKHVFHGIDKLMPRTEVVVESLVAQQGALL